MTDPAAQTSFRLAYVPGVTPSKWVRVWGERHPEVPLHLVAASPAEAQEVLRAGEADAGLVRLPVDRDYFSAIPLYTEATVVVVPKDHLVAAADEVTVADLADDIVLHPLDDLLEWERLPGRPALERPATTGDAVELVAAGIGVLVVPQSLARLHHRRDLTYRPLLDAPESKVALSWPEERTTELVEDFIGVVRGRTVNSTRGRRPTPPQPKAERTGKGGRKGGSTGGAQGGKQRGGSATRSGAKGARGSAGGKGGKPGRTGKPRRRS
ncbi:LysR family transcriptional regulator substrate-binding protein [Streptomyces sp. 549]|uniref:LysR family transcriptional regulator substrate-binding protein n=1 Tax=Streptomyces sp. 549 TaxID=3049076 RepID=UPI0024C3A436|nr:LysR family transcriptional regulator substrate-binding protein [Streptomyces sp. 549]MDK1473481.1 LysR family transcriptional regulator substrate-binding protein [Streptomyces sp. 549]